MPTTSPSLSVVNHIVNELKDAIDDCSVEDTKLLARALSEVLEAGFVFVPEDTSITRAHQRSLNEDRRATKGNWDLGYTR